jgi:transposase
MSKQTVFNESMAAYSLDLRKRIVGAVERGNTCKREIARMFSVHETFVHKLLRQKRERGDIAPLPHCPIAAEQKRS